MGTYIHTNSNENRAIISGPVLQHTNECFIQPAAALLAAVTRFRYVPTYMFVMCPNERAMYYMPCNRKYGFYAKCYDLFKAIKVSEIIGLLFHWCSARYAWVPKLMVLIENYENVAHEIRHTYAS